MAHSSWLITRSIVNGKAGRRMVETTKATKGARKAADDGVPDLHAPALYINRELSNLEYFARVLAQASDPRHPLLERANFLGMASEQIDEFFMVRVSDLQDELSEGLASVASDGMTPGQQLTAIRKRVTALFAEQGRVVCEGLLPS